jgi:hypothetical protein
VSTSVPSTSQMAPYTLASGIPPSRASDTGGLTPRRSQ